MLFARLSPAYNELSGLHQEYRQVRLSQVQLPLKNQYDFIMIITHLDIIKDYMDILLPVQVDNTGFSNIIY